MDANECVKIAERRCGNNTNAQFCLREAKERLSESRFVLAAEWARKSLAYSVGAFNDSEYNRVAKWVEEHKMETN